MLKQKICRGGCWYSVSINTRNSARSYNLLIDHYYSCSGFRVMQSILSNTKENLTMSQKYRIIPKEEPEEFYIAIYNTFSEAEKAAKELCMKHRISVEIVELQAIVTYNPSVLITKT